MLKNQNKEKDNKDLIFVTFMKLLILLVIFVFYTEYFVDAFEMDVGSSATISGSTEQPSPGPSGGGSGGGGRRNRELVNETTPPIINDTIILDFRIKDNFKIIPKNKAFVQLIFNESTKKSSKIIALDNNYIGYYIEEMGVYRIGEVPTYVDIYGFNLNISYSDLIYFSLVKEVPESEKPAVIEKYVYNTLGVFLLLLLVLLIAFYAYYEAKRHKFLR
mgnify:CR=1 FL=1